MAEKQSDYEYYKALAPKAFAASVIVYGLYWLVLKLSNPVAEWTKTVTNLLVAVVIVLAFALVALYLFMPAPKKAAPKATPKKKTSRAKKR